MLTCGRVKEDHSVIHKQRRRVLCYVMYVCVMHAETEMIMTTLFVDYYCLYFNYDVVSDDCNDNDHEDTDVVDVDYIKQQL